MKKELIPIERFIEYVNTHFISSQFTSPEAIKEFDWSDEKIKSALESGTQDGICTPHIVVRAMSYSLDDLCIW